MSITGASSTFTAGGPKSSTTAKTNQFSALEDKDPARSNDSLALSGASSHSSENGKTPSLSNPCDIVGEMIPGDADIPDSIAKALLDAL